MITKTQIWPILAAVILLVQSCMKDNEWVSRHQENILIPNGVFILNEGNFMYGNSSLSFYDPMSRTVNNELFYNVNGLPLGDVGQSMIIRGNKGYIVMNNSGKVYIIDINTGKYTGKITGLTSPRYLRFINDKKAYITDLYAGQIKIFNPETDIITDSIITIGHPSTEQMVQVGSLVFVTCWSYDNTVLIIDSETDSVIKEIKTGKQPGGIVKDRLNKIWVLSDGGWGKPGSVDRTPYLQKIDPVTGNIELTLELPSDVTPARLAINGTCDTIMFLSKGIWRMPVNSDNLPETPLIPNGNQLVYALGIDPKSSEIYFSDAIDYSQRGIVYRYSAQAAKIDSFKTGIIPGFFCFK